MTETNAAYLEARETMKRVFQMPEEERKTVLSMLRGAVVISDLYSGGETATPQAQRPGA